MRTGYNIYTPAKIVIDTDVAQFPITRHVLENKPSGVPCEYITGVDDYIDRFLNLHFKDDPIAMGKQTLVITANKGSFFKCCPGTPRYLCCLYKILNFATGCPLDCSYCILQGYFSNPLLTLYANTEDMERELEDVFSRWQGKVLRIGTGEFTDSLALDPLTGFNSYIIPFIRRWDHVFFEIKTKTTNIHHLEEFGNDPHIICSWSLNPDTIIESEEHRAPGLEARLEAARQCQEWGFGLGFHFDPLLYFDGWEDAYHDVVERLFKTIDWRHIYWISLGSFR